MIIPTLPRNHANPYRRWLGLALSAALAVSGCRSLGLAPSEPDPAPAPLGTTAETDSTRPDTLLRDTAPGMQPSVVSPARLAQLESVPPGKLPSTMTRARFLEPEQGTPTALATTKTRADETGVVQASYQAPPAPANAPPANPPPANAPPANLPPANLPPAADGPLTMRLGFPVLPPLQQEAVDLCAALERAGVGSPIIALADEAVRAADALRLQADVLVLPNLNAGGNIRTHQGSILSSAGQVKVNNLQSFYFGMGASAKAAESVAIPGIQFVFQIAEAYFAPQQARQIVLARRFDALDQRNRTLDEVGTAYLRLTNAQGELNALRRSEQEIGGIAKLTANFSRTGQGKESDAQRAEGRLMLVANQIQEAQEKIAVASAELSDLLNLDPSVRLISIDELPPVIELVNPATPLPELLQTALARHPAIRARFAEVAAAQIRARQEKVRPWVPLIMAGASWADFGGSTNTFPNYPWTAASRIDIDVLAVWTLQNLGLGNRAIQNRARAEVGQAEAERLRTMNRVREQVAAAFTEVLARRREVEIARRRILTSQQAYEEDLKRARNLEGIPIEVLSSLDLLKNARLALVRAMAAYSQSQLDLFVALGNTPACVEHPNGVHAAQGPAPEPQPLQ